MFFNGILALSLRTLLVWENKKLDRKYGSQIDRVPSETGTVEGKESGRGRELWTNI
jgi:hypothetical protein